MTAKSLLWNVKIILQWIIVLLAAAIVFFLFAAKSNAQVVDIQVPRANQQYIVVARNAQFGQSGGGNDCTKLQCGFNDNFIFPALFAQEMICVTIFNTSSTSETFNFTASASNDPQTVSYSNNTARWFTPVALDGTSNANGLTSINAGAFGQFYVQVSGAARVVLVLSGSSLAVGGGADIVVSQSQTNGYSANPGIIINSNVGNPNANIGGVNVSQVGNSSLVASSLVGSPAGPASSLVPAVPVQPGTQKGLLVTTGAFNPFLIGCDAGVAATVTAGKIQYIDCDSLGRPLITGQTGTGTSLTGLNPVAIGISDGSGNAQFASSSNPVPVTFPSSSADPCSNVNIEPSGVAISITSATTTLLVAISGSTSTYICGVSFTMVGAAETIQFVSGTQTTNPCDTGQQSLTGAYTDGTVSDLIVSIGYANRKVFGGTVPVATSAQQICAVTTGTVSIKGHMSFVQK